MLMLLPLRGHRPRIRDHANGAEADRTARHGAADLQGLARRRQRDRPVECRTTLRPCEHERAVEGAAVLSRPRSGHVDNQSASALEWASRSGSGSPQASVSRCWWTHCILRALSPQEPELGRGTFCRTLIWRPLG